MDTAEERGTAARETRAAVRRRDDQPRKAARATDVPPWYATTASLSWRFLVIVAALALLVYVLILLRVIVLPVVIALFLATLLVPLADKLRARNWPNTAATLTVFLGSLIVIAGIVVLLVPLISNDISDVREQAVQGVDEVQSFIAKPPFNLTEARLSDLIDQAQTRLRSNAQGITSSVVSGAVLAGEIITGLILTLVLLFFFVKDGARIGGFFLDVAGRRNREDLREMGNRAAIAVSHYFRGVAIVGLVDAFFIGLGLVIMRVPFAVPLAFLTFIGAFLPLVGAFLAGTLATLVALVAKGPVAALVVIAITVGVQQLEGHVLAPVVLGRSVQLHPIVILLALGAGSILGGIVGAFLSVPLAAVVVAVGSYLRGREPAEMREQVADREEQGAAAEQG
jgi:predicted PurR-regulated permease PerM